MAGHVYLCEVADEDQGGPFAHLRRLGLSREDWRDPAVVVRGVALAGQMRAGQLYLITVEVVTGEVPEIQGR